MKVVWIKMIHTTLVKKSGMARNEPDHFNTVK